jgi:hypothetical protein
MLLFTHQLLSTSKSIYDYDLRSVNYNFDAEPVPEPATVLLFVSGMIGVGAVVARKRRKTN